MQNYNPSRPDPEDASLLVTFFDKPVRMGKASELAKEAVYEDQEYVQIIVPFKRDGEIERKVVQRDIERFPAEYEAFKSKEKVEVNGTLITNWNFPGKGQVQMLTREKVTTVEQLASLHDAQITRMGNGARALRDAAKDFVAQSGSREVEDLKEQVAKLTAMLEQKDVDTNSGAKRSTGNRASK